MILIVLSEINPFVLYINAEYFLKILYYSKIAQREKINNE